MTLQHFLWWVLLIGVAGSPIFLLLTYFNVPIRRWVRRGCTHLWNNEPPWLVRDVLIALLVLGSVATVQIIADDARSHDDNELAAQRDEHDNKLAVQRDADAQRLENLRFVRDRASATYLVRPFRKLDLQDMNLAGLELRAADFSSADLTLADLTGSNFQSIPIAVPPGHPNRPGSTSSVRPGPIPSVPVSLMVGTNLCGAVLTGTNFDGAWLINANFGTADLRFTMLTNAFLYGADLSHAQLPDASSQFLANVHYDNSTKWPKGFRPPPLRDPETQMIVAFGILKGLQMLYLGGTTVPQCHS
jgi:hypothetical protein